MIPPLGLVTVVCFLIGIAIVVTLSFRAGARRPDGTIARVLYDTENPEK